MQRTLGWRHFQVIEKRKTGKQVYALMRATCDNSACIWVSHCSCCVSESSAHSDSRIVWYTSCQNAWAQHAYKDSVQLFGHSLQIQIEDMCQQGALCHMNSTLCRSLLADWQRGMHAVLLCSVCQQEASMSSSYLCTRASIVMHTHVLPVQKFHLLMF